MKIEDNIQPLFLVLGSNSVYWSPVAAASVVSSVCNQGLLYAGDFRDGGVLIGRARVSAYRRTDHDVGYFRDHNLVRVSDAGYLWADRFWGARHD